MDTDLIRILIPMGALAISVIIHEVSHAYSAYLLGDPTGKNDGRISLNPLRHIDPFMTILLPAMMFLSSNGRFAFGGARPVRINPQNFRNPSFGMMVTAAAGPISNFLQAIVGFAILYLFWIIQPTLVHPMTYNALFFGTFIFINVVLGVFNLIPIPPMDGSRILRHFVPEGGKRFIDAIEPFGLLVILMLVMVDSFDAIIRPFLFLLIGSLDSVFGVEYRTILLRNMWGI